MSALRKSDSLSTHALEDAWQQSISAMLDGESTRSETDALVAALKRDEGLRETWSDYQLIGDAIRGDAMVSDDFMSRFSAQLAAEPTVLAPRRRVWPQRLAVVSFASFALWGVVSLVGFTQGSPDQALVAVSAPPPIQQASLPAESVGRDADFTPYLAAHGEFSPTLALSPYDSVMTVAVEPR